MSSIDPPRIVVLSLGGTIGMMTDGAGVVPKLGAAELLSAIPDLESIARVEAQTVKQVASADLGFADIAAVAARVRSALADGAAGVVVTQGTDTLEETAFLLDLLTEPGAPVVVTGAMRSPAVPGADGPANLLSAIRVASTPAAAGLGVLVVMNDEIHAARFVRKMHAYKVSAFASPAAGPIGWVAENRVRVVMRLADRLPTLPWRGEPPNVPLVPLGFATMRDAIEPFVRQPPAGLVIMAMGAGHVPSNCVDALGALAARCPVVLTSRAVGEGFRATYGYSGGEIDLLQRRLIPGGCLDAAKARVMLSLLLADGADRTRIEAAFALC